MFEITYFFLFAYAFFGHIPFLTDILRVLSDISLLLVVFLFFRHTRAEMKNILLKILPLLLLSSIFIFTSNNFIPFKTVLLILASSDIDFDERIKFDLRMRLVFIIVLILLSQVGLVSSAAHVFKDGSNTVKYDLGFSSPNTLGLSVFIMCLEMVYLARNREKNLLTLVVSAVIMILVNIFTGSRTAIVAYIIFMVLVFLYKYRKNIFNKKLIRRLIVFSPLIITTILIILYFVLLNNPSARQVVDQYSSGRFTNAQMFINNFPILPFGNDISILDRTCDVTTVYTLYAFGVVGTVIYLLAFVKLFSYLYKKNNVFLILVFVAFLVYGVGEKLWLYPDYNIFMTAFSLLFGMNTVGKEEVRENA